MPADLPLDPVAAAPSPSYGLVLELCERLSICSRLLRQRIARFCQDQGLNEAQLALLWACLHSPSRAQSQKELAERLAVSPAHVSGLVEQLRLAGMLIGRRDVSDRRRQQWELTPAGHTRLQTILERLAAWAEQRQPRMALEQLLVQLQPLARVLEGDTELSTERMWGQSTPLAGARPQRGAA